MDTAADAPAVRRGTAALDLVLFLAVSGTGLAVELGLRRAGLVDLPDLFSGLPAVVAGFVTALVLVRRRGQTWRELGLRRPTRWVTLPLWVLGVMGLLVVIQNVVLPSLAPLLDLPPPDFSKYDALYGNLPLAAVAVVGIWATAAVPEELIYRGFLLDRFARIVGGGRGGLWAGVLLQGLVFGAAHYQWGLAGIVFTATMGALFGTVYVLAGRNLWPLLLAHGIMDSLSMMQFYLVRGSAITPDS